METLGKFPKNSSTRYAVRKRSRKGKQETGETEAENEESQAESKKKAVLEEFPGLELSMALICFHQVLVLAGFC